MGVGGRQRTDSGRDSKGHVGHCTHKEAGHQRRRCCSTDEASAYLGLQNIGGEWVQSQGSKSDTAQPGWFQLSSLHFKPSSDTKMKIVVPWLPIGLVLDSTSCSTALHSVHCVTAGEVIYQSTRDHNQ